jgi:putative component of membrane protein insertase Oxa1/YidC/SpoIIIJ protein YidD
MGNKNLLRVFVAGINCHKDAKTQRRNMKYLIFFFILVSVSVFGQTKVQKWGKADISYQMKPVNAERNYGIEKSSATDMLVSGLTHAYWIFISDVDGDNCAFSPSCSSFFIESVKETNIFQGILMFADRLTRDTNFIDRQFRYPFAKNGRLFDVPSNYKLDAAEIKYIPPFVSVNDE